MRSTAFTVTLVVCSVTLAGCNGFAGVGVYGSDERAIAAITEVEEPEALAIEDVDTIQEALWLVYREEGILGLVVVVLGGGGLWQRKKIGMLTRGFRQTTAAIQYLPEDSPIAGLLKSAQDEDVRAQYKQVVKDLEE